MNRRIYFVAAEPSGDALAADVIDQVRKSDPGIEVHGVGGEAMKERGINSPFDISELAVLGLIEGLKAYRLVKQRVEDTCLDILKVKADVVVLVDSWGFTWRVAKRLRELGSNAVRIKLIGPQVWATRPGRAKTLAAHVEHLLCIHAFEPPFYEAFGLKTTVIGNPALGRGDKSNPDQLRRTMNIPANIRVLGLLLGSRQSEMRKVAPTLVKAAKLACSKCEDTRVVCIVQASVASQIRDMSKDWRFDFDLVEAPEDKFSAFAMMDVALACSGTVTTELAAQGTPVVVGYKTGWLTWAIARAFLMKSKFITLLNVAAGNEVAPEFIQTRFTASKLADVTIDLLNSPSMREAQIVEQNKALLEMGAGGPNPAVVAANKIVELTAAAATKN